MRVLTGIKPTGTPHIGNYFGAIRPAIELSKQYEQSFYFIADYHALTSVRDPQKFSQDIYHVAATWLALGLDPKRAIFFKQSDVPETFELTWILGCLTPKGDLNRAHSYKDKVAKNLEQEKDPDQGVNLGLFSYPVLMAADILLYDTNVVPVGKDQIQHIEIARSIAQRFNQVYGQDIFVEPHEKISEQGAYVTGLDGRKMSKSYDNAVELWLPEKKLKKIFNKIVTDSSDPSEPKDPETCNIMALYKLFASEQEVKALEHQYREGMGWGVAKAELFNVANEHLKAARAKYEELMAKPEQIDEVLAAGAKRARAEAQKTLSRVRKFVTGAR